MNPVVLIATHKRLEITSFNIESLQRQSLVPKIVLVVSEDEEFTYFRNKFPDVHTILRPNKPLGLKWDQGVQYIRSLKANPLIILGSDDILGENFIQNCTELTLQGNHFICLQRWFIHHKGTAYLCDYMANLPLGGGRCYSEELLKKLNYSLFDPGKDRHLDDHAWTKIRTSGLKVKWVRNVLTEGLEIHAIKGDWEMMNKFDLSHKNIKVASTHKGPDVLPDYYDKQRFLQELPRG